MERLEYSVIPIGYVENEFEEAKVSPETIRSGVSRIHLKEEYVEGLEGIGAFEKIVVVFLFDRSEGFDLKVHPRGDRSRPMRGVFSTRSPRRPNRIGVTTVDLLSVDGTILNVRGLDAINGTPVLDIKQY